MASSIGAGITKRADQVELALAANIVSELKADTPVDTGFARGSWRVEVDGDAVLVVNSAPYIRRLNAGSSTQAPAGFVEKAVARAVANFVGDVAPGAALPEARVIKGGQP